jgi:hypothetical protein
MHLFRDAHILQMKEVAIFFDDFPMEPPPPID